MTDFLEQAKEVLNDLEKELEKGKAIWESFIGPGPDWEKRSKNSWIEKQAKSWLHGATHIVETNELDRWHFDRPPLSETARTSAKHIVKCWREWLEIKDGKGAYYMDNIDFAFEDPLDGEILINFLLRMSALVEEEGFGSKLGERAIKSLLAYLRNLSMEEIAFIEQIFPQKMGVRSGRILRKIPPEAPAISQQLAAEILKDLAYRCRSGRVDSQHSAAESLGLSWLCLTASRLRLPIHLETLFAIKKTALLMDGEFPVLLIPTFFGDRPIRISRRVAKFLWALSEIASKRPRETILQKSPRKLRTILQKALEKIAVDPKFGNVTYVTLLSPPHHFGNHRYQPK